jgi:hypothetical protein
MFILSTEIDRQKWRECGGSGLGEGWGSSAVCGNRLATSMGGRGWEE